jgi:tripartite-type tricarboxylate transporter receptor subunit TctC
MTDDNHESFLPVDRRKVLALATGLACAKLPLAFAQEAWPTKPVKLVVPFAAGGGSDAIARFAATRLASAFHQPFVVDNKPGAGGNLGVEQGLRAPADGYTLTLIASSYSVNAAVYKLGFDPVADITPIIQISTGPLVVVVNPRTGLKNVGDLVRRAKANPGQLNFATSGAGGVAHAATELFLEQTGIKMTHIPYKGAAPAMADTLAGVTDVYFSSVAIALPQIKAGKLTAIAVTTAGRLNQLPDVPTMSESGVAGYEVPHWHGLIGPKGMPTEIVMKLNQGVNAFLKEPGANQHLESDGVSAAGGTPTQLKDLIVRGVTRWKALTARGHLKVD